MRSDENTNLAFIKNMINDFCKRRGWEKYHNLKDLAIALCVEASELLDIFKWRDVTKVTSSKDLMNKVKEELADVMIYAILLAIRANIDLTQAILEKLEKNKQKYPEGIEYTW